MTSRKRVNDAALALAKKKLDECEEYLGIAIADTENAREELREARKTYKLFKRIHSTQEGGATK